MFSGSIPALVTPIRDGAIDEQAFAGLVEWQIAQGSSALVPCGTTGESATMTIAEHDRVVALTIEVAAGPGARHRRLRLQSYQRRARPHAIRREGRRGGGARRAALL